MDPEDKFLTENDTARQENAAPWGSDEPQTSNEAGTAGTSREAANDASQGSWPILKVPAENEKTAGHKATNRGAETADDVPRDDRSERQGAPKGEKNPGRETAKKAAETAGDFITRLTQPGPSHPMVFNGAILKWIAVISMAIDHVGASLVEALRIKASTNGTWYAFLDSYDMMRNIGRLAFPIFCFMIVEGFTHTSNRRNYLRNLLLFGCISEIPFDMAFSRKIFSPYDQNVMFTLALGLAAIWAIDELLKRQRGMKGFLIFLLITLAAYVAGTALHVDYSGFGVVEIILLYMFRNNRLAQCVCGAVSFMPVPGEFPFALISFPLLYCYNGERGRQNKRFFYIFYPAHLLILGIISMLILR